MSMDSRGEFPQYYHVEDPYGNVFAVVCKESDTEYTVIQKRDVRKSFVVSRVSSEAAVKDLAPGQLLGCSIDDYQDVLDREFGFKLSPAALNAKLKPAEDQTDDRHTPPPGTANNKDRGNSAPAGTDVQSTSGASPETSGEQSTGDGDGSDADDGKSSEPVNAPTSKPGNANDAGNGRSASPGNPGKSDQAAKTKSAHDGSGNSKPVQDGSKPGTTAGSDAGSVKEAVKK